MVKNLIKLSVKAGILHRNDQFNAEELAMIEEFRRKFLNLGKTVISFQEVEFSYDRAFLVARMRECRNLFQGIVQRHLTEKSVNRIELIFRFFSDPAFLDQAFRKDYPHREIVDRIVQDLHKSIEEGRL
ncbi:unnamed protein product [Darwinula stevensoni]|uniref:Uncharacterized protein n=1 Tax=Darwinula stevensoni TaxID=69355 RepID=A0A7R9AJX1_9CRUS|nr:unnamed protein product [Darwinula stevensoni]CAG0907641.1 unnamed protein product [Darwinula stevensoni]